MVDIQSIAAGKEGTYSASQAGRQCLLPGQRALSGHPKSCVAILNYIGRTNGGGSSFYVGVGCTTQTGKNCLKSHPEFGRTRSDLHPYCHEAF